MNQLTFLTLAALLLAPLGAAEADFRSKHLAVGLSRGAPTFSVFSVDSLGQGKLNQIPVLPETNAVADLELADQTYRLQGKPVWRVTCSEKVLTLRADYAAGVDAPPFTLAFTLFGYSDLARYTPPLANGLTANDLIRMTLDRYLAGKFQGFDSKSGCSLDWRDWQGGGHGCEGLLVDNYHALLAVLEDVKAKEP